VLERLADAMCTPSHRLFLAWTTTRSEPQKRTLEQVRTWPRGCDLWPTDSFARNAAVQAAGEGWAADAAQALAGVHPFAMAHTALKMTIEEAHAE